MGGFMHGKIQVLPERIRQPIRDKLPGERAFDVSESTIDNWKAAHPEFLAALKTGRELADAEVANSLYRRAIGDGDRPPDVTACIFWLKNRRPDWWRDAHRQEHAITTPEQADTSPEERARQAAEMVDRAFG